jgi:hypothetical protein
MVRTFVVGLLIAVAAALVLVIGGPIGLNAGVAVVGVCLGAVLALVGSGGPFARIGAWAAGFVLTWVSYAVTALLLPSNNVGSAVGAFIGLVLVTLVAGLTRERLPLWCGLLGVATFVGSYFNAFDTAPYLFKTQSIVYLVAAFAVTMIGFFAASAAEVVMAGRDASSKPSVTPAAPADVAKSEV